MSDYWPKVPGQDLFCTLETAVGQTGLSRATVTRATKELQEKGFLVMTQKRSPTRSARYRPVLPPSKSAHDEHSSVLTTSTQECSDRALTLDVTPNTKLSSELHRVTADASTSEEIEPPSQRDPELSTTFEDWRPGDQELFADAIGCTHIRSDGTGPWGEGEWPVSQWYDAFRQRTKKPLRWPGQFFEKLEADRAVEDYLAAFGLEPVDVEASRPVVDPWATTKSA